MDQVSESSDSVTVAVFAKQARAGEVMTRLGAAIGEEEAAELYRAFLADIAHTVGGLERELERPIRALCAYTGRMDDPGFAPFDEEGFEFIEQSGADLGARLSTIVEEHFSRRASPLLIIGADSPTLSARHFEQALDRLSERQVVLGPSFDGGYYLIGLDGPHTSVFREIDWSSRRVLGQTLRRCREASLLCETLEFWYDVDTIDDLKVLEMHLFDYLRHHQPSVARHTAERLRRQGP
ncbi:MAG: TIGR04282 family arsenosugar biosynthesis glycosyltransferase [Persicimonas sp.]